MLFFLGLGCLRESGQAGASTVGANTGVLSNTGKEALTNGEPDKEGRITPPGRGFGNGTMRSR